jgi:uncharacterized protein
VYEWTLALLVLLLPVFAPDGLDPTDVGLSAVESFGALAPGLGGAAGALIAPAWQPKRARREGGGGAPPVVGGDSVLVLLPRNGLERWMFAGVAVTAGAGEEHLFRGFLLAVLVPDAPGVGAAGGGTGNIEFAHAYQGVRTRRWEPGARIPRAVRGTGNRLWAQWRSGGRSDPPPGEGSGRLPVTS